MKSLILVVEDDISLKKAFIRLIETSGISCFIASNLEDAITYFKQNEKLITHILLDANDINSDQPNVSSLAKIIAESSDFRGEVFVMSTYSSHNEILMRIIGDKCENLVDYGMSIKQDTLNEVIRRIKSKRKKENVR